MKKTLLGLAMFAFAGVAIAGDLVWIEGESAIKTNLTENKWLKGDNPKLLSGGDAFSCLNERSNLPKPAFVLWKLDVPADGQYHMYFRHIYTGHLGKMRYRFVKLGADGKPEKKPGAEEGWVDFDLDSKVMDQISTGQWRTVEWTRQAPVNLKKGQYIMDLQIMGPHPGKINEANPPVWVMFDVICLTTEPFTPSGSTKPGEKAKAGGGAAGATDYY